MKKIIILDFTNGRVYVHDYDVHLYEDGEQCIIELVENGILDDGVSPSNCQWMIVDELSITIL